MALSKTDGASKQPVSQLGGQTKSQQLTTGGASQSLEAKGRADGGHDTTIAPGPINSLKGQELSSPNGLRPDMREDALRAADQQDGQASTSTAHTLSQA